MITLHKQKAQIFTFLFSIIVFVGCSTYKTVTKSDLQNPYEAVKAGEFDNGKMWTFDFPPMNYFEETYNFKPTQDWFDDARLSALRLPGCSASFVSEDGLVMTNHHCARGALDRVNKEGENLPELGFWAATLEEERKVPNYYVDQLVLIEDVTDEVKSAFESGKNDDEKVKNRQAKMKEIEKRYNEKSGLNCSVVTFFNGGKYSIYGYKRYNDVRLVFAPETQIAFFGGDYDNFTYPRYDLDCAFFRVYDEDGKPLKTKNYFKWSKEGAKEGEVIFVIGNPGRTSRLLTIAQLEYFRDYSYPYTLELLDDLTKIYSDFLKNHPDKKLKYQSQLFGLANSQKAFTGYLGGLKDPYLMAKKKDFEKSFRNSVMSRPDLKSKYGSIWEEIAVLQKEKSEIYYQLNGYNYRGLGRAIYFSIASDLIDFAEQMKMPEDKRGPRYKGGALDTLKMKFLPENFEEELQLGILSSQLGMMKSAFGKENDAFTQLIANRTPEAAAKELVRTTIILNKDKVDELLNGNPDDILNSKDPFISFVAKTKNTSEEIRKQYSEIQSRESAKVQPLGNTIFDIYGTSIPPDATFTLRIADGVVKTYEYNGTIAPPITTYYGMYDRYYSFMGKQDWDLPERWKNPPSNFDLSTPINFVSTADIIGGNSGSPLVNKNLEIVGLAFDGNIESLPGNFIFDDTKNRTVSVHSAGMLEAFEDIYKADRLVTELKNGMIGN